jgi:hypothetical protein
MKQLDLLAYKDYLLKTHRGNCGGVLAQGDFSVDVPALA